MSGSPESCDIAIVGGGAAGLATAIFAARIAPSRRILVLDGARKLGAKILVSGGGRCNVTNQRVSPDDYFGGSRNVIRRVLDALPVARIVAFFAEIGVSLHVEDSGKLFPDSNSARSVLGALLDECRRLGVQIRCEHRVISVRPTADGFETATSAALIRSRRVVLATGGLSLPKTGSDGLGFDIARSLGHTIVPTTPALAGLVLEGDFHAQLSGLTHAAELTCRSESGKPVRIAGSMVWTHFGLSGPAPMNLSRVWHRESLEGRNPRVTANLLPGHTHEAVDALLLEAAQRQPRAQLASAIHARLPSRLAEAVVRELDIDPARPLAHLDRSTRRRLVTALLEFPLRVRDSRGYAYAEATAGGVDLREIDPSTMASRRCPGLSLVGEVLDVDGRIGGFNFQWAWSSAFVAGRALASSFA